MMQVKIKLLIFIAIVLLTFLSASCVSANNDCQRVSPDKVEITVKIAFWNDGTLDNATFQSTVAQWQTEIDSIWNSSPNASACNIDVEFKFVFRTLSGCNSELSCCVLNPQATDFHCVMASNNSPVGPCTGDACMDKAHSKVEGGTHDAVSRGWWNWNMNDRGKFDSTFDFKIFSVCSMGFETYTINAGDYQNSAAHEIGHAMGLEDRYCGSVKYTSCFNPIASGTDGIWDGDSEHSLMGANVPETITASQQDIDRLVYLWCFDNNAVCHPDDKIIQAPLCRKPPDNICSANDICTKTTCGTAGVCQPDCTCSGDTCEGACQGADCDPATQVPGMGTCTSTPGTKCCKPIPSIPPGGGGGGGGGGGTGGDCIGLYCSLTCIKDGSCTVCNVLDLVVNFGKFLLSIVGALALFFIVYGGFTILLSAGIGQRVTAGRTIIINSIIGLVIALTAYVLVAAAIWLATGETSVFVGILTC